MKSPNPVQGTGAKKSEPSTTVHGVQMGGWKTRSRVPGSAEQRAVHKGGHTSGGPWAAVTTVVALTTVGPTTMGSTTGVGPIGAQVRTPLIIVIQFLRIGLFADCMPDDDRGWLLIE